MIRTITTTMALVLFAASSADGQTVGWSVGLTHTGVEWDYPPGAPSPQRGSSSVDRQAFTFAVSIGDEFAPFFGWSTGLRLVPKGYHGGPSMRYLEVPVSARFQSGQRFGLFGEVGLSAGRLVRCEYPYSLLPQDCGARSDFRNWELAWAMEGGLKVPFGSGLLILSARRQRSLTDVEAGGGAGPRMLHRVSTVGLGYEWRLPD